MKLTYRHTEIAAYIGYVVQAIVNNFSPLLFVTFMSEFSFSLGSISALITVNFGIQIVVDISATFFLCKIGYRRTCVISHLFAAAGLISFAFLPFIIEPYIGVLISTILCAIGGGLDEVIISPVMEALPGTKKAARMSLLHSFYCWGQVLTIAISTLLFKVFGMASWRYVSLAFAFVPVFNAVLFMNVPILELEEGEKGASTKELFGSLRFIVLMIVMLCAGASELAMSQWASFFAEKGLNVSKAMGDILGPCLFAVLMGGSRLLYGIRGKKMKLRRFIYFSGILCIIGYAGAAFSGNPYIALLSCGLIGFSVGIMWPGTYSIAAGKIPKGGSAMFALLAFGGDFGCAMGPMITGLIADRTGNIRNGLAVSMIFPLILVLGIIIFYSIKDEGVCKNGKDKS